MIGRELQINIQDKEDADKPMWEDSVLSKEGVIERCGIMEGGMKSGLPSIGFFIQTHDGPVVAQLSYNHFEGIYHAMKGAMERWEIKNEN